MAAIILSTFSTLTSAEDRTLDQPSSVSETNATDYLKLEDGINETSSILAEFIGAAALSKSAQYDIALALNLSEEAATLLTHKELLVSKYPLSLKLLSEINDFSKSVNKKFLAHLEAQPTLNEESQQHFKQGMAKSAGVAYLMKKLSTNIHIMKLPLLDRNFTTVLKALTRDTSDLLSIFALYRRNFQETNKDTSH